MQAKLQQFHKLLKEEQFFEAHEVLEEIWFPKRFEKDVNIDILKGFINAAVSFELLKRKRVKQSKKVWRNYLKYRTLLYKTSPTYKNHFYQTVRFLDSLRLEKI